MKKGILVLILLAGFSLAGNATPTMDESFNRFKEEFVRNMWQIYPGWASSVGFHGYDTALVVPDSASRRREIQFCEKNLAILSHFDLKELGPANKTDYHLIENQLKYSIFIIQELKAYEWDPSSYNVSGGFAELLGDEHARLDGRLRKFYIKMKNIPEYYEAAKKNINNPTREHTDLAMEQNEGGLSVFKKDLEDALAKSTLPKEEQEKIRARAEKAQEAIHEYVLWLRKQIMQNGRGHAKNNETAHSFRLGKQLYDKKFAFEIQSGYTAEQIYAKAIAHKKELHEQMYTITEQLWPKYMGATKMPDNKLVAIKKMIDTLSVNHVKPADFQSAIEKQIPELVNFINKKNLIYIDPSKPLVVRKEPAYMAGVAGASINAPGPYDKNGNTYYNVGSLEGWSPAKAESYLREYNHYILQILNIHEAIPGHYTQLVYANRSPSIIKSILGNNAMIEGWAVYTERMMLENGYDGDRPITATTASPEMWLMYYKWNLRSTCNMILDYDVHTKNLSEKDAMKLLMDEAFQERTEAVGKWKRVSVTQVQLSCYFTGYTEIYDLREEMKVKDGKRFDLKNFHQRFLSYGSAPIKYIKELMLAHVEEKEQDPREMMERRKSEQRPGKMPVNPDKAAQDRAKNEQQQNLQNGNQQPQPPRQK